MDRLVTELEAIWNSIAVDGEGQPTGVEWLPVDHVGHALCTDLGYEDMPEFEDALKGAGGGWRLCCVEAVGLEAGSGRAAGAVGASLVENIARPTSHDQHNNTQHQQHTTTPTPSRHL